MNSPEEVLASTRPDSFDCLPARLAFAYLRVSGKAQVEGDGFERQLLACQQYASDHGLTIVEVFREEGVSGTNDLEDRPALSQLFAALQENGIKTVLVERLDRLARDVVIQELLLRDMRQHGYTLISAGEPDLCSDDPTRTLMRQILGAFAEYERKMIVLKLRGARQRAKAREGRCEGQKPFGEHPDRPQEGLVLAAMLAMAQCGLPAVTIAQDLNTSAHPTRSGRPWSGPVVAKILRRQKVTKNCALVAPALP